MVRMPHWPLPLWHRNINYELNKMQQLLAAMGNVHLKLPPIIHVAGTNGKGSTIAFMRSILESFGLKVHCYTSPHLVRFNERIVLASNEITDSKVYEIHEYTRIIADNNNIEVTFFEGITAAAFLAFSQVKADICLIETGMGGRLDATNIIMPELTVITPISYDHTMYLGEKLYQIAGEKAGIMKENVTCISSLQSDESFNMLEHRAQTLKINLIAYEYDFIATKIKNGFIFQSPNKNITLPMPNLKGDHQYINAATAVAAITNLKSFIISDHAIIQGISNASWVGRLEKINNGQLFNQLPNDWQIYLDGAHNDAGAQVLSLWVDEQQDAKICLIIGMTKGRNIKSFLQHFVSNVDYIYSMLVEGEPSSYKAEEISEVAQDIGIEAIPISSFSDVIVDLKSKINSKVIIIICGSLYLVGDALMYNNQY